MSISYPNQSPYLLQHKSQSLLVSLPCSSLASGRYYSRQCLLLLTYLLNLIPTSSQCNLLTNPMIC